MPTTIGGLLRLCSSERYVSGAENTKICRRNYLLNDTTKYIGPIPVFRVEMADKKHVFCSISSENWNKKMLPKDLIKHIPSEYISDEAITDTIWLTEDITPCSEVGEQLYRTRHELFNEHLPVFNFIGDVDLKLREDTCGIEKKFFFDLCRSIRKTLIEAWSHIFPDIDKKSHPIFFFKSACQPVSSVTPDDAEYDFEPQFCVCRKKLGMRIIIPLPRGTAVFGSATLKRLAKILDHTMSLDRELVRKLNTISHPGECFDTGIYNHARSVRMALMYKFDENGILLQGRLNPIFIIPEHHQRDPREFILQQLSPKNLTHHANPHEVAIHEAIIQISDRACSDADTDFLQTQANKTAQKTKCHLGPLIQSHLKTTENPHKSLDPSDLENDETPDDLEETEMDNIRTFAKKIAWPYLLSHVKKHYRPEIQEQLGAAAVFHPVGRNCVSVKRIQYGRSKDFRCLTRDHKTPQETVQVFMDIRGDSRQNVWVTLWSRCFTRKCKSNAKHTHVSVKIPAPSQY